MVALGCVHTQDTNFVFPPILCELDCHRCLHLWTFEYVHASLYMSGARKCLCQVLVVHKYSVGEDK